MWPSSDYVERDTLPEYGLAAHLYVEGGELKKTAFSVFKIVQDETTPLTVVPADELYAALPEAEQEKLLADVQAIVSRVTGCAPEAAEIQREYTL